MTQEELDELAGECRLAFGYQANAFNDGVDAMLRAVSIAQAQAAEPTIQEAIDAGDGCLHSTIDSLQDKVAQQQAAMRLALEALRELADCGAEAWSAERPCVKDGDAAIAALEGVL